MHAHSSFASLLDNSLMIKDYRQLIRRLHGFYVPLDAAIQETLRRSADTRGYDYAARSSLLGKDMIDLGYSERAVADAPQCPDMAELVTPVTLGGVLYVIEGATLGGAGIDRAVQRMLPGSGVDGRRYWAWCRAQGRTRWDMANAYLEDRTCDGVSIDDLKRGALGTFRLLADWLAPLDRAKALASAERV